MQPEARQGIQECCNMGRTLKTKKNPARHVRASVVHAAILELSTVHKIRTVSHTSRYQKSAYLEEPCLDLLEIPSRKSLRSCTICFWYTNRTSKNLVFRLPALRTGSGTQSRVFGVPQMQPEARQGPRNVAIWVQSLKSKKNSASTCEPPFCLRPF